MAMAAGRREQVAELVAGLQARRVELVELMDKAREHALAELGPDATGELSHARLHAADMASDAAEQMAEFALCALESAEIERIDQALQRAHAGLYGVCVACQREIEIERLRAAPESLHCVGCAGIDADLLARQRQGAWAVEPLAAGRSPEALEEDLPQQKTEVAVIDAALAIVAGEPLPAEIEGEVELEI